MKKPVFLSVLLVLLMGPAISCYAAEIQCLGGILSNKGEQSAQLVPEESVESKLFGAVLDTKFGQLGITAERKDDQFHFQIVTQSENTKLDAMVPVGKGEAFVDKDDVTYFVKCSSGNEKPRKYSEDLFRSKLGSHIAERQFTIPFNNSIGASLTLQLGGDYQEKLKECQYTLDIEIARLEGEGYHVLDKRCLAPTVLQRNFIVDYLYGAPTYVMGRILVADFGS